MSRSALLFLAALSPVLAYNPPADTAGPLTVSIEQPSRGAYGSGGNIELTSQDLAIPIRVHLSNASAAVLRGTLRVRVIDHWTIEPSAPAPFVIPAHGSVEVEFTARASKDSYNGHYPVHVIAECEHEGKKLTAHPILILEAKYPNPPRAVLDLEWRPAPIDSGRPIALWRLPMHRESARVGSGQPLADGRDNTFQSVPAVRFDSGEHGGVTMRLGPREPSMREVVEAASVEYPVSLPAGGPVNLQFKLRGNPKARAAVRVRRFDGAANVRTLMDKPATGAQTVDLGEFAGQAVRIELEASGDVAGLVHFDEPVIMSGAKPAPVAAKPPHVLGTAGAYRVELTAGRRGVLDSGIAFVSAQRKLRLDGFRVRVLGDDLEDPRSASKLLGVDDESAEGRYRLRHRFDTWAGRFDLLSELRIESGALRVRFWIEHGPATKPWLAVYLEEVKAGPWSELPVRIYAGPGNVIEKPEKFFLGMDGHLLATSFVGFDFPGGAALVQASDATPDGLEFDPATSSATLRVPHAQTMTFLPVTSVWEGVKQWREISGTHAAGGVAKLAGRFVLDYWDTPKYREAARELERAFRYGLTDSLVIYHNWQRWGYDFRLPDLFPPNPSGGTLEDFASMAKVCRANGVLFAPHDNYIDFYPDFDGFSYSDIVFHRDGTPYRAWFHFARQAQSYRARPDRVQPFVERNVKLIKDGFAPTAYFIDVWSSMAPYDFWTSGGEFKDRSVTQQAWGNAFAWIRDTLGDHAPQISEAGHDRLIGWLDGGQANQLRLEPEAESFAWRIKAADSERIPWIDAAYHDRFILHGAGYSDRYAAGLDQATHGIYSGDYIATEVLTGRPAMVAQLFSRDVVRKYWLLHDYARGLALARIDGVAFDGANFHRQRVRWSNGAEVHVNRGRTDWSVAGHVLPEYGYYARVPVEGGAVESAIERRDGRAIEWSRSPSLVYVNGRGAAVTVAGVTTSGAVRVTRDSAGVLVTPLPESGALKVSIRTAELPWKGLKPARIEALDEAGRVVKEDQVADALAIELDCRPEVFAYRLK